MRVLHVIASGKRRGAEIFAADLAGALNDIGITQHVALVRGDRIDVRFDAPVSVLATNGRSSGLDPRAVRSLRRFVRRWRPDIVHAHGGEALKYAVPATIGRRAAVVYRRIGSAHPWVTYGLRRTLYGWLIRRASRVVAVAETVGRETAEVFRVPSRRIEVIPNGVDPARLSPSRDRDAVRRELGIPLDATVVVSVGALTWEKNPLAQVQLAQRVLRAAEETRFVMVGDGPMRAEVEAMARRRGVDGRFMLLGSRDDVPDLLAASDIFLLTSRTEGMPGCLIEAGLAGLPAVAYSVGGVPEVVEHGTTGLLAPARNLDALEPCLIKLLADPDARREMGLAARRRCAASFDIRTVAARHADLFAKLRTDTER